MSITKTERLLSLDVFRGITIAGMILVNNPGTWKYVYPPLRHAEWHGCTPTDLIFPFFLFIVGVAVTYSLSKRKAQGIPQSKLILQIGKRSIILFLLGLIMAGFPYFDLSSIRIPGVLQRIGVVYFVTAVLYLKSSTKTQAITAAGLLLFYWILMTFIPVPGVGDPNLEPETNLGAWLDRLLLGGHLWSSSKTWDPEGILSTLPAVSTALIGVLTGEWLRLDKDKTIKTVGLFLAASFLMLGGYVWDGWFPINKSLWTSSYVLYTGGLALNFLAVCYWFIDVKGYKFWIKPFLVYGMNAITVFFLSGIMAKLLYIIKISGADGSEVSLKSYLFDLLFLSWLDPYNASLLWAVSYILLWLGLMWILYAKNIFIKV
jgi:predicted acyltransferase